MNAVSVTAHLDEVRLRSRKVGANGGPGPGRADRRHRANEQSARDVPHLLAAVDAALRLAAELDAEDVFNPDWPVSRGDRIHEAISAALLDVRMPVNKADEPAVDEAAIRADERARIRSLLPYHIPCCENFLASVGDLVNEHGDLQEWES